MAFSYDSKLHDWYGRASVRVKPERVLTEDVEADKLWFTPELVPTVRHPEVLALGDAIVREVLVQRLYNYLEFVARLELDVVNRVTQRIAHRKIGFDMPPAMVLDAYKIITDEAYHAQFAAELKHRAVSRTGVQPRMLGVPRCLQVFKRVLTPISPQHRKLAELFFAIVSETLISSGVLSVVPRDGRVVTTVRMHVADHAEDEGRHHVYFARVMEFLWPRLSDAQRAMLGPLLAGFVRAWLEPDFEVMALELTGLGLTASQIQQVVLETYPPAVITEAVNDAARATLRLFDRVGVFADPRTVEEFQRCALK